LDPVKKVKSIRHPIDMIQPENTIEERKSLLSDYDQQPILE